MYIGVEIAVLFYRKNILIVEEDVLPRWIISQRTSSSSVYIHKYMSLLAQVERFSGVKRV